MVTLHIILVQSKVVQINKKSIEKDHPECRFCKVRGKTTQAELLTFLPDFQNFRDTSRKIFNDQADNQNRTYCFYSGLNYFSPYYSFNTTKNSINNNTQSYYQHYCLHAISGKG